MRIFDFVHAYQPFFDDDMPDWVIKNMEEVFLPLSRAMSAGIARHTVQIQGWTLESWASNPKTKHMFAEIAENIRSAVRGGYVDLAFSAYSHPILPLLSNNLASLQIEEDYKTVLKYLGEPKIFFPPEGAIDRRILNIVNDIFPGTLIMVPDKCVSNDTISGFYDYNDLRLAVFPVLVKNVVMGAPFFEKPPLFVPPEVEWEDAKKALKDPASLERFLTQLSLKDVIIARDMENGESRDALSEFGPRKREVPSIAASEHSNHLLGNAEKSFDMFTGNFEPASWEPLSTSDDPFPFWSPQGEYYEFLCYQQQELVNDWLELVAFYDELMIAKGDRELFRRTSPIIISCFPWHFTTPLEWNNNIGFSQYILEHCIKRYFPELFRDEKDEKNFNKIVSRMDLNLKDLQSLKSKHFDL
ncbi:MAG: hypothetical protein ACLFNK_05515 [Candidatus Woesearchaeota archaeon]